MSGRASILIAVTIVLAGSASAEQDAAAIDPAQIRQIMAGVGMASPAGEEQAFPDFAEVTKGMKSFPGLFTLWYYPPDAKDKDQEKLLAQVPVNLLGEQIMLSTSYSGGGFFTGFPLDERVVKWVLRDRTLLLIQPETGYVVDESKEVSDVVRRTYPERIRAAVPVVTKSPAGDPVIDLGPLLKSDFADISWMNFGPFLPFGAGPGRIEPQLSQWRSRKSFELNVEIGVELAVSRRSPPGSFDKKMVHYSFWRLPKSDYQPRLADDRIGYFLTTNVDWSKPVGERELFNRYINRWHLVKRDPSLEVSEPRQPIIFYIEKTVPVRWRRAVRDGILEWNKAFERIGFANAVEVRQQTDDNEWKDLDPEDMRYSFIRWIVTGQGFAMGPSRANPFTGQIYDADIIFDDSMVRFYEQSAERYLPQSAMTMKLADPTLHEFTARFPQWLRPMRSWESASLRSESAPPQAVLDAARRRYEQQGHVCCDYARGMEHQLQFAGAVLGDQPAEVKERLLYEVIKEVVMHEVGHTLGLRHNFIASSVYSLEELNRRRTTGEPLTGSVMDYNPVFFTPNNPENGAFVTTTIGPYDEWAIEYGYRPFDGTYKPADKPTDQGTDQAAKPEQRAGVDGKPDGAGGGDLPEPADGKVISVAPAPDAVAEIPEIPQEVLAQLPPDARRKVESAQRTRGAGRRGGGGRPRAGDGAPAGAAFKAAPAGETAMLLDIARRATDPQLAYATDEDTTFLGPDPRTNRFDMGADPIEWANTRIELVDKRLANIMDWAVKDKESWRFLRPAFLTLLLERTFVLDYVGRYIGGQYFTRTHRGDLNAPAPFVLVEPARQRAALAFIEEHLFSDQAFRVPPELLNHLAPSRWWHDGASISFTMDFPIHDYIALAQWWNLFDRLFPEVLRRMHDAELKTAAPDKFTVAEYIETLQRGCWGDATAERVKAGKWSDAQPMLSSIRRSLQREYLGLVEPLVRTPPGQALAPDLHAMVQHALRQLSEQIAAALAAGPLDFASRAHLSTCKARIDRILSSELREYERPSMMMSPFGMTSGSAPAGAEWPPTAPY
jgi:hypothetical protein